MVGQWSINALNTLEAIVFKRNINNFCCNFKNTTKEQLVLYHYPPDIYPNSQLPTHLIESLKKGGVYCHWHFNLIKNNSSSH